VIDIYGWYGQYRKIGCPNCGLDFSRMAPEGNLFPHFMGDCKLPKSIEQERSWEAPARRQRWDNLLKWILVAMGVIIVVVLVLVATSHGEVLPDAPHLSARQPIETYGPNERMIVHNHPNGINKRDADKERIVDWSFVLGHGIYAGATAFDNYQTAKNLGTCAFEGNPDLGRNPSNRDIATHASVEFAAVVAGDLLIRWYGTRHGIPRWLNMAGGNLGSAIGTIKHARGGMQWVNLCH